jgi:hypothetical protein
MPAIKNCPAPELRAAPCRRFWLPVPGRRWASTIAALAANWGDFISIDYSEKRLFDKCYYLEIVISPIHLILAKNVPETFW